MYMTRACIRDVCCSESAAVLLPGVLSVNSYRQLSGKLPAATQESSGLSTAERQLSIDGDQRHGEWRVPTD
jgi:hypothetical protein